MKIAKSEKLQNIKVFKSLETIKDKYFDAILLYDVLHPHYFNASERKEALKEIFRVSKNDALISTFPKHIELDIFIEEVGSEGFYLKEKIFKKLIHDDDFEENYILNFKKVAND